MQTVVHLRVYEPMNGRKELLLKGDGSVANTNQLVKLKRDTVEWHNWLKHNKTTYAKVVVEACGYSKKIEDKQAGDRYVLESLTSEEKANIQSEVDQALTIPAEKKELSREELMAIIEKQQAQINQIVGGEKVKKAVKAEPTPKPTPEPIPDPTPEPENGEMTIEDARALYENKFGKKPHHAKGIESILSDIEEAN